MKALLLVIALLLAGCTTREYRNYITNNTGPADWQGPVLTWITPPDAEARGTVGLDLAVTDSSAVARVALYLDGRERQALAAAPYRFEVVTDSLLDGVHWCEARAWDVHGNLGLSPTLRINVANSLAAGPRLLWVPDGYPSIQAAINAATDFDTIRVRDDLYRETLNLFGKGLWLESEHGPMHCTIDAAGSSRAIAIMPSDQTATIRGFWLTGGNFIVAIENARVLFVNNIVQSDTANALLITSYAGGDIVNNLFIGAEYPLQIAYHWGSLYNNIVINASQIAMWNATDARNPLEYGYNLFWNNEENYHNFNQGEGDVFADPLMDLTGGMLATNSPAIDNGNPFILDQNGTRSDIGPFGGPWAY